MAREHKSSGRAKKLVKLESKPLESANEALTLLSTVNGRLIKLD